MEFPHSHQLSCFFWGSMDAKRTKGSAGGAVACWGGPWDVLQHQRHRRSTQELVVLTQVTRVDDRNVPCPRFMLGWYNLNVTEFIWYIFIHIYIHIHTFSTGTGNSGTLPCPLVSDPKSFQDGRVGSFRRRRSALVNGLISGSFYRKPWLFSCTSKGKSKPCKVSLQPAFPKIG